MGNVMSGAALLIGNARYGPNFGALKTPVSDIHNLGDRLHSLRFETYIVPDADRANMVGVISQFGRVVENLSPKASVFFYFAGHGLQRDGENYLVPVDAHGSDQAEVLWSCLRLSELLQVFCGRGDIQKLLALDACRSNRIPSTLRDGVAGLAGSSASRYEGVKETFVLYATEPGYVAQDGATKGTSPFCRGLLRAFEQPYEPIHSLAAKVTEFVCMDTDDMQVPWATGTLRYVRPFIENPIKVWEI